MGFYTLLVKYLRDIKTRQSFDLAVIVTQLSLLFCSDLYCTKDVWLEAWKPRECEWCVVF